jgi:KTSC domain
MTVKVPIMTPVVSSNVLSVGHDGAALYVRFRTRDKLPGALYRYPTAGPEHHRALLAAPSPGSYFAAAVRGVHDGELVRTGATPRGESV